MAAINPHLTPTTYGRLQPGDRVLAPLVNPARTDAHLHARTVAEIIDIRRHIGWASNWTLPRRERVGIHRADHGYKFYDYETVIWRDTGGHLYEDRADETAYTTP